MRAYFDRLFEDGCAFFVAPTFFAAGAGFFFAAVFRGARFFAGAFLAGGRATESRSSTLANPVLTSSSEMPR